MAADGYSLRPVASPLTCPFCARQLREVDCNGTQIDVCDCGGMWFDADEIAAWASKAKLDGPVPDGSNCLPHASECYRCPRCAEFSLKSRVLHDVFFARCDECAGIWLTPEGVSQMNPAGRPERGPRKQGAAQVAAAFLDLFRSLW
jgi:Zn-finger nucleic acid-binding protein